ncbi:glycosyltransferase [Cellulomonas bogoriensis]|uniref:glycosyltransferase n=1 Tax=Cellulomonas bogoriensis TaxID=301388 RepID=UPI001E423642|nr:glycosyltransferase [Cellulomonas bogoriensis]
MTTVHHPQDSRIRHRQIDAMLGAGWQVTYAAPWRGYGVAEEDVQGLRVLDVPRARGRRRLAALGAARRLLAAEAAAHDVVLLHDPELLLALSRRVAAPVVWDVHEDTAAAVLVKPWLPVPVRRVAAAAVRRAERRVESRVGLLLAEHAYQERFRRPHPVVPNTVKVPAEVVEPGGGRVVYVGSVSVVRGARELCELGARLTHLGVGVEVVVVGGADPEATALLRAAHERGVLTWWGFRPSSEAFGHVSGALAGLSLLHDVPNFRHSMPTKVIEYMAHGVPVVTTPLPLAVDLVEGAGAGVVVPFGDVEAVTEAVVALARDPQLRARLGSAGHAAARRDHDWSAHAGTFLEALRCAAGGVRGTGA